jgi:hypothetical protein
MTECVIMHETYLNSLAEECSLRVPSNYDYYYNPQASYIQYIII